jgi:eukaryotic-like serine/threonine-protein kinase
VSPGARASAATPSPSPTPAKRLKLEWYKSDAGWKAGVPKNWNRVPADFAMWWFDPQGRAQLTVEVTGQSGTDPLGALREAEAMLRPTVTGYTKVRLRSSSTTYGTAADWELTWTQRRASAEAHLSKGVAYHQYRRVISTGTTTSVLTWTTTAAEWARFRPTLQKAFSLFKPPA